jgi:hypothetical protein
MLRDPGELHRICDDRSHEDIVKELETELERLRRFYRDPIIKDPKAGNDAAGDSL